MKEIFVKIPDENIELASQQLEKLGAEIKEKKSIVRKPNAKKLRIEAWDRRHKFLLI